MAGAAVAHNFGLASSGEGPTANGKIAVVIGFVVLIVIATVKDVYKRQILLLFAVSILTFALVSASPIDPLQANVGQAALGSMSAVSYTHLAYVFSCNPDQDFPCYCQGCESEKCCNAGHNPGHCHVCEISAAGKGYCVR